MTKPTPQDEELQEQFSMKFPSRMREKLEEIARYEDRSLAAQIRVFLADKIKEYFEQQGPPQKKPRPALR